MIIKHRTKPTSIRKLEALQRRIPRDHPRRPFIDEGCAINKAGYKGELALNFPLKFLPQKDYLILHDLRLQNKTAYFQIDCLLKGRSYRF
ncbi:nuclease-related domain-containing protein [Pseudalkalibacillus decolorationis]|uniref:nuclease-related domain-containing protein n=1 Tax=Pseudalkalibacillus decolorationis TaxID=163879 RepID=UPI003556F7C5